MTPRPRSDTSGQNRRKFLKSAGAVAVTVGAAGCTGNDGGDGGGDGGDGGGDGGDGGDGGGGGGGSTDGGGSMSIGLILSSAQDDLGWSQAGFQDIQSMVDKYDSLEINDIAETVAFGDYQSTAADFAGSNDIVISHSNGYLSSGGLSVSRNNPDTTFLTYQTEIPSDATIPENHGLYNSIHQAGHQMAAGYVAGLLTENNQIGMVSSLPVLVILHGLRGAICGMKTANPDAEMRINWIQSGFYDPEQERQNAQAHVDAGVDVIMSISNSAVHGRVAAENDLWATGAFFDQSPGAPDGFATSPVVDQTPYFDEAFAAITEGTWSEFWNKYPDHHPWSPKDYPGTNPSGFAHSKSDTGFHPDVPDDVVSEAKTFAEKVSAYEASEVQFSKVWKENVCPDGTEFELEVPS
jgi:basic membrane lipoprotein Med (substrate-binding protein (PBP1-ABC) superfamily)